MKPAGDAAKLPVHPVAALSNAVSRKTSVDAARLALLQAQLDYFQAVLDATTQEAAEVHQRFEAAMAARDEAKVTLEEEAAR